jgi:hypothetical protein
MLDYEVEVCWARLRRIAQMVATDGDAMFHGLDWGERALSLAKHRPRSGLDTASRVFWWDATRALEVMHKREPLIAQSIAVALMIPPKERRRKGVPIDQVLREIRAAQLADPLAKQHPQPQCRDKLRDFGRGLLYMLIEGLPAPQAPACTCRLNGS